MKINEHYLELEDSYLFSTVARKQREYQQAHPEKKVIRLSIGDVTLPLAPVVIKAMEDAVKEMGSKATFRGYGPEQGYDFLREAVQAYYQGHGVSLDVDEIFISDGAKSDLGNLLDIFSLAGTGLLSIAIYTVLGVAAPLALFKNFGGSMIMIILGSTLLIGAWTESGFIQRYAYWCMSRPIVGNNPARFLIIFGLSCGLLSVVVPNIPLAVLFTAIAVATAMVGPISFLGLIIANLSRQLLRTFRHSQLVLGSTLFGMIVLVPFIRRVFPSSFGDSLLAMILILAIMVLPTIISVSETALRSVPASYKEASLALGNTHIGTIFKVLVPAAKSGILAGVILGVGRAVGETMAVVMVCGNKVQFPQLLKSVRPLTSGVVLEMSYAYGLHRQALFSIGLVLFVFIMIVNISFTMLSKRGVQISGKE